MEPLIALAMPIVVLLAWLFWPLTRRATSNGDRVRIVLGIVALVVVAWFVMLVVGFATADYHN